MKLTQLLLAIVFSLPSVRAATERAERPGRQPQHPPPQSRDALGDSCRNSTARPSIGLGSAPACPWSRRGPGGDVPAPALGFLQLPGQGTE